MHRHTYILENTENSSAQKDSIWRNHLLQVAQRNPSNQEWDAVDL